MNNKSYLLLLATFASLSYAESMPVELTEIRDADQSAIPKVQVNQQQIMQDQLHKQNLTEANTKRTDVIRYTGRQLVENPAILEKLFLDALVSINVQLLPTLSEIYKLTPNYDASLIEWSDAILARQTDLNKSVSVYRNLISNFPDNNFIRYQLAETLFYNQEYQASQSQFEKLRASNSLNPNDITIIDNYIDVIKRKDEWNFSFSSSYLRDKNLANSAKPGTTMQAPNGGVFTYNTPQQSGHGIYISLGADKRWNLNKGKYLALDSSVSSRYYWDKKNYNDLNTYLSFGLGYSNARYDISFMPYISKRWYAGGFGYSKSLKEYSNTYGFSLSNSYWINKNVKYSLGYTYGYDKYDKERQSRLYNGNMHSLSNTFTYLNGTKQYWILGLDLTNKSATDKTNAYNRIGVRLSWGQEWPLGVSSIISTGYGKRKYREKDFLGKKQSNNEYSTSISLWHKKLHFAGFTPRVTWSYNKTDSNLPIYSYDKNQILFEVGKTF